MVHEKIKKIIRLCCSYWTRTKISEDTKFKETFDSLTPDRQKGYILHIQQAKQFTTRTSRIEKNIESIFIGKDLHDCVCGISKKMPNCDDSHYKF